MSTKIRKKESFFSTNRLPFCNSFTCAGAFALFSELYAQRSAYGFKEKETGITCFTARHAGQGNSSRPGSGADGRRY